MMFSSQEMQGLRNPHDWWAMLINFGVDASLVAAMQQAADYIRTAGSAKAKRLTMTQLFSSPHRTHFELVALGTFNFKAACAGRFHPTRYGYVAILADLKSTLNYFKNL
jgi:hypothetical protein